MTRKALIIHPRMIAYGGGELICLHTARALQEEGYQVSLFCDSVDVERIETQFGMGAIAQQCTHIPLFVGDMETFPGDSASPRFSLFNTLRRVRYIKKTIRRLEGVDPHVVFQTQPSAHFLPGTQTFEFMYQPMDIEASDFYQMGSGLPKESWKKPYFSLVRKYRNSIIEGTPHRHLFALSRSVLEFLHATGHHDSALILPPCRQFKPMMKKNQVVTVARVDPVKRLEVFCEVANSLPEYRFVIVGIESPFHPGYKDSLLSTAPANVVYVDSPISLRPELLAESKVYLHTASQRGFGIAIAEGLSAGCIPVCYSGGDGAEVVKESGVGYIFDSTKGAIERVRNALEDTSPTPMNISERARIFSAENFETKIQSLAAS